MRGYPEWFFFFGQGEVLGVPFQLWILGLATLIAAVILGMTPFGRATYATGANETAARFLAAASKKRTLKDDRRKAGKSLLASAGPQATRPS